MSRSSTPWATCAWRSPTARPHQLQVGPPSPSRRSGCAAPISTGTPRAGPARSRSTRRWCRGTSSPAWRWTGRTPASEWRSTRRSRADSASRAARGTPTSARTSGSPATALDGGLQERLLWPDALLVPLPESLSDDAGALLEPLGRRDPRRQARARPSGARRARGRGRPYRRARGRGRAARGCRAGLRLRAARASPRDGPALRCGRGLGAGRGRGRADGGDRGSRRRRRRRDGRHGRRDRHRRRVRTTRCPGGARWHPVHPAVRLPGRRRPPQGAHLRDGAADARHLRAGDRARDDRHRPRRPGERPLPARAVGRGVRARRRAAPATRRSSSCRGPELLAALVQTALRGPGRGRQRRSTASRTRVATCTSAPMAVPKVATPSKT